MSDLEKGLLFCSPRDRELGQILIAYYKDMKILEHDEFRGPKQVTLILMVMNDIEAYIDDHYITEENVVKVKNDIMSLMEYANVVPDDLLDKNLITEDQNIKIKQYLVEQINNYHKNQNNE